MQSYSSIEMHIFESAKDVRNFSRACRKDGKKVALVPTMVRQIPSLFCTIDTREVYFYIFDR